MKTETWAHMLYFTIFYITYTFVFSVKGEMGSKIVDEIQNPGDLINCMDLSQKDSGDTPDGIDKGTLKLD